MSKAAEFKAPRHLTVYLEEWGFQECESHIRMGNLYELELNISDSIFAIPNMDSEQVLEGLKTFCAGLKNYDRVKLLNLHFSPSRPPAQHEAITKAIFGSLNGNQHLLSLEMRGLTLHSSESFSLLESILLSLKHLDTFITDLILSETDFISIITTFFQNRKYGTLDLRGCTLTDNIAQLIMRLPEECSVSVREQALSPSVRHHYWARGYRRTWRDKNHGHFSLYQRPYELDYLTAEQLAYLNKHLTTQPCAELTHASELEFTSEMTGDLALSQLIKLGEPNIWRKRSSKRSMGCYTPFFCHLRVTNSTFDGERADRPMTKAAAQHLLEAKYGERASLYWIIDQQEMNKQYNMLRSASLPAGIQVKKNFFLNNLEDFFPSMPLVVNTQLPTLLKGLSPDIKRLDFFGCIYLSPNYIIQAVMQFPQLEFLGLHHTQPWNETGVRTLAKIRGDTLTSLEIPIHDISALACLTGFKNLRTLKLDLSNSQLADLNYLNGIGQAVTELNLTNCIYLRDLSGLQYCQNLTEICFYNVTIVNLDALIDLLSPLTQLRLIVLVSCQFPDLSEEQLQEATKKMQRLLPNVFISASLSKLKIVLIKENEWLFEDLDTQRLDPSDQLPLQPSLEENVSSTAFTSNTTSHYDVHQRFWTSSDKWPDPRMDRLRVLTGFKLDAKGAIILSSPSSVEQYQLQILGEIKTLTEQKINKDLLMYHEKETQHPSYRGRIEALITKQNWEKIPSRGVCPQPFACSIALEWARSKVTGELFVRLPTSSTLTPGKMIVRYAAQLNTSGKHNRRHIEVSKLPPPMITALTALSQQRWAVKFPLHKLLQTMRTLDDSKAAITKKYALIKKYCHIGAPGSGGFTAEVCNPEVTAQVREFVDSLEISNPETADSLIQLVDTLLQQRGGCAEAVQTAKYLADYFKLPFHAPDSRFHTFYEHPDGENITEGDLGGRPSSAVFHPLSEETFAQTHSLAQQKQLIKQIEDEYKPVFPRGYNSSTANAYWQEAVDCRNPIIHLPSETMDMDLPLASLVEFITHHPKYSISRFVYIDDPRQYQWLKTMRVSPGKAKGVPGLLGQLLRNTKEHCIFLIHPKLFEHSDFMETQSIGENNRTFKDLNLPPHIHAIVLAPPKVFQEEEIFLSRFSLFAARTDLWGKANRELIRWCWDLPSDIKAVADLKTTHLYNDASRAETALTGTLELKNGSPNFKDNGALSQAIKDNARGIILTDIPDSVVPLLRQSIAFNKAIMINGELIKLPKDFKIYRSNRPQPDLKNVNLITALPETKPLFYTNPGTYSFAVLGSQRVDPETGDISLINPVLSEKDPPILVATQPLSNYEKHNLADMSALQSKPAPFYQCPEGTDLTSEWKPSQGSSGVIEAEQPEQALAEYQSLFSNEDILTLTPQVGVELLMQVKRGQGYALDYKLGWLAKRLLTPGCITVLIGDMPKTLYYYLESVLATTSNYLYLNGRREKVLGSLIWIKPTQSIIELPAVVNRYRHTPSSEITLTPGSCGTKRKREAEDKSEHEQTVPMDTENDAKHVNAISNFMLDDSQYLLILTGPAGSGRSTSVKQAVQQVTQQCKKTQHFFSIEEYVAWRTKNPRDQTTLAIVQWDNCHLLPPAYLEFLRDIRRNGQFYWQGEWYPAPKIILTADPLTNTQKQDHPLLADEAAPQFHFSEFTPDEIKKLILLPLLSKIKELKPEYQVLTANFILLVHAFLKKQLPNVRISSRDFISLCQRLEILLCRAPQQPLVVNICRAIYEEFSGLFPEKNQSENFWQQMLTAQKLEPTTLPIDLEPIQKIIGKVCQSKKLKLTKQQWITATLIQRTLQIRDQFGMENFSGKYGIVLEGPPGLLKTELPIAVLEALGFTPAPDDEKLAHADQNHYLNITTCQADILEKRIQQCVDNGWILLCNEANFLTPNIHSMILKAIKTAKKPPQTRFRVFFTQNTARAGSTPLPFSLLSYLQRNYIHDYTEQDLIDSAKQHGLASPAELIAKMFTRLQSYQKQLQSSQTRQDLVVANPRHYFNLLDALSKKSDRGSAQILACLMETCCMPILSPKKEEPNSQYQAMHYILEGIPYALLAASPIKLSTAGTFLSTSSSFSTTASSHSSSAMVYYPEEAEPTRQNKAFK